MGHKDVDDPNGEREREQRLAETVLFAIVVAALIWLFLIP